MSSVVLLFAGRAALANTVMIFNPWDGQLPLQVPVAFVNGLTTGVTTTASGTLCGWYQLSVPSIPSTILFQSSGTATNWGAGGIGSSTTISLSAYGKYDTVWIAPVAGAAKVTTANPGNTGTCQSTGTHTILSSGRCDLLTAPLTGSTGCMDLSKLDGTTLQVPSSVTRLSTEGLVLCGGGAVTVPGNDIAYIVDQSGSMTAFHTSNFILPHGADTINFNKCNSWTTAGVKFPGTLPMVTYKGNSVQELPVATYDSAMVNCTPNGDPYQVRASVVQAAITKQAQLAPTSTAAFISFGTKYSSTKLFSLRDTLSRDSLLRQVIDTNLDKTYYTDPIGWARALLQGATSGSQTMPASPNTRKAIIMVSDGAPNDATSTIDSVLVANAKVTSPTGTVWTLPNVKSPPIYGFMLSTDSTQGKALKQLAAATGGAYYLIPPLDRDSLNRVMERLLGLLTTTAKPDSLRITNLTNGEISTAVASGSEGAGYRFRLDSIIGLDTGANVLEMHDVMHGTAGDSVVTIRWTVDVSSASTNFAPSGADTTLMAACFDPTRLRMRPTTDTSRTFADQRDASLSAFLDVRLSDQFSFPIRFSTTVSKDTGKDVVGMAPDTAAIRALLGSSNAWVLSLTSPVRTDAIIQTGYGWDTLRAVFHMPRDPRDSAVALLPLLHLAPVSILLSPDTASGNTGRFQVVVSDPNISTDTASAEIHHRLGDSLRVKLQRTAAGTYQGSFAFQQNQAVVQGDTVLQLGPSRTLLLDSVWATYQSSRDTALVKRINPQLRFVDSKGQILDSIPFRSIDLGQTDTIRVGLFVSGQLLLQTDSVSVATSSWLSAGISGLHLSGGLGTIVVQGTRPGTGGSVVLRLAGAPDSLWGAATAGPLTWRSLAPDSAVYLDRDGDGALDHVRVSFRLPWNPANLLVLHWPDSATVLDLTKAVPTVSADSLTVEWSFNTPQSPLTTAWTTSAIPGNFSWNTADPTKAFPVREEIAPAPVRARLSLGSSMDTLRVWVSEPIQAAGGADWVRWGRPSRGLAGDTIVRIYQDTLGQVLELLVDTSFAATSSDSIRLAVWPKGGISDPAGNGPSLVARWVPLEVTQGPFKLSVAAWPPMTTYTGWSVSPTEPALSAYVRTQPGTPWLKPDGQAANLDSSRYSGALIKTTRNLDGGILYLYDNAGVFVASVDLTPLLESLRQGSIKTSLRGDVQIWVAWNGTSTSGRIVSSGVYLARMFGWTNMDGKRVIFNQIYKLGWRIPGK